MFKSHLQCKQFGISDSSTCKNLMNRFLRNFEETRRFPLKIQYFMSVGLSGNTFLMVWTSLDSTFLQEGYLDNREVNESYREALMSSEQWKNSKAIRIINRDTRSTLDSWNLKDFVHLECFIMSFRRFSAEDVWLLILRFRKALPIRSYFAISSEADLDMQKLLGVFDVYPQNEPLKSRITRNAPSFTQHFPTELKDRLLVVEFQKMTNDFPSFGVRAAVCSWDQRDEDFDKVFYPKNGIFEGKY